MFLTTAIFITWSQNSVYKQIKERPCLNICPINPLTPNVAMGIAIEHPVPDRVKPSFVMFDIRALWRSGLSVRVPGCQKLQITAANTVARTRRPILDLEIAAGGDDFPLCWCEMLTNVRL